MLFISPEPTPPNRAAYKWHWFYGAAIVAVCCAWWAYDKWLGDPHVYMPWAYGGRELFLGKFAGALVIFGPLLWVVVACFHTWLDADHAKRHQAWRQEIETAENHRRRIKAKEQQLILSAQTRERENSIFLEQWRKDHDARALARIEPQLLLDYACYCLDTRFIAAASAATRDTYKPLQWRGEPVDREAWILTASTRPEIRAILKNREHYLPTERKRIRPREYRDTRDPLAHDTFDFF